MELFRQMIAMSDEEIANIHPKHNSESIKSVLQRLHYFQVKFSYMNTISLIRSFSCFLV